MEEHIGDFDTVEYAIYHREHEATNYTAFCRELK